MKKLGLLLMPVMAVSFLVNCKSAATKKYLCFTAQEDNSEIGYLIMCPPDVPPLDIHIQTSTDIKKWTDWNGDSIIFNKGDKIYVRNLTNTLSRWMGINFTFTMEGKIAASGSVMSMINFGELTNGCFSDLFLICEALTTAPELPSKELRKGCYQQMFNGCYHLTKAPNLPATELKKDCYSQMFVNCITLTQAPSLPATTLESGCYSEMFANCSRLKVSEGKGQHKIFTCPDEIPNEYTINGMFEHTGGEFKSTPTKGNTYYYN